MSARFSFLLGLFLVASFPVLPELGGCEEASLASYFGEEPAGTLVRHLEPGLGFSVDPPGTVAGELATRFVVSSPTPSERIATDRATGLAVTRSYRRLIEQGLVIVDTRLSNRGDKPLRVQQMALGSWSFRLQSEQDQGFQRLTYRDAIWYGSTYWTGPNWTRVGRDWHHPGTDTPSVRRFTAPHDGRITISGRIHKLDTKRSDGVRLSICHRQQTVWQGEIDGRDDKGVEPEVSFDVRTGDAVRFVVHKRGEIYCDTTHWDPLVTYADGKSYQASQGFSTTRQGLGGWSYEMQAEGDTELGLPRIHALGRDLALRELPIRYDEPVGFDHRDVLPAVVLADGIDQSGVVIGLNGRGPWELRATLGREERLALELRIGNRSGGLALEPGASVELPQVVLGAYQGEWLTGLANLGRYLQSAIEEPAEPSECGLDHLRREVADALVRVGGNSQRLPDLDLCLVLQAEWRQEDALEETAESYAKATAEHHQKVAKLLEHLRSEEGPGFLVAESTRLAQLASEAAVEGLSLEARRLLYQQVRWLKRRIALANPRLGFEKLLFSKRVPTSYSHLVMQYYGWRARPGGGLFILENPGTSLVCRDLLDGRLAGGNVLEPRLSYDAKRIVFSYVKCPEEGYDPKDLLNDTDEGFYHVWEVNVDGSGLRQLTQGPYDDLMPTYLPDGGIAFSSTRRRGYARCFGAQFSRRWHVYTLHRIDADGGNLRTLSYHDTNEWFPTVSNTGLLLYARWDYIDRDAVTHQNLWASHPDGTNPFTVWGNATPSPHCAFQLQPIPNSPKIVFTASAHHSIAGGSIAVVDPTVGYDGHEAIRRITPEIPFPEAEGRDIREYYTSPWPLSEHCFLVGYCPTPLVWEPGSNRRNGLGIYLLDSWGNRELIYRDLAIGSTNPCPLVPRPMPPALPSLLAPRAKPRGEMVLGDVYEGLGEVQRGRITHLRIVQIFPKTTNLANQPPIGLAREENGRAILGTVPVEPDGSARFYLPANKPVYFQALDAEGFAYQTMRSATYVQPGERLSCVGCHEHRRRAPVRVEADVMALGRPPSQIDPGELGGRPFSYAEVVQPIWDKHCLACHSGEKPDGGLDLTGTPHEGFSKSYVGLLGDVDFWKHGTNAKNAAEALVPRFGGRNQVQVTPPGGVYGAAGSRLVELLRKGHEEVELSGQEIGHLATWIDLNAIFYGVNLPEAQARQLAREPVPMPEIQ